MEWLAGKEDILKYIKKYRYVLLVVLAGLFLMAIPAEEEPEVQPQPTAVAEERKDLQDSLADILGQISGAGKVEVLLTQAAGTQTVYQTDEDISGENIQRKTVIVTNADREETGLIQQVNPPVYLGAVVLCQGADDANVQLSIVRAVMSATGLTSDHITVLKMK